MTRKWTSWGPKAAGGEGSPTAGMGCPLGRPWPMARAVALLHVDPTRSSETGTFRGLRWHTRPRERKGVWGGKDRPGREREGTRGERADGHRDLRRARGQGKWRETNRRRQLQTAPQPGVMPTPQPPAAKKFPHDTHQRVVGGHFAAEMLGYPDPRPRDRGPERPADRPHQGRSGGALPQRPSTESASDRGRGGCPRKVGSDPLHFPLTPTLSHPHPTLSHPLPTLSHPHPTRPSAVPAGQKAELHQKAAPQHRPHAVQHPVPVQHRHAQRGGGLPAQVRVLLRWLLRHEARAAPQAPPAPRRGGAQGDCAGAGEDLFQSHVRRVPTE